MLRYQLRFLALFLFACFTRLEAGDLVINEFMASNVSFLENPDLEGDTPDWFELFNSSAEEMSLGGFYLSDDVENYTKWEIPQGVKIAPAGFLLFYADGFSWLGEYHTNFKLRSAGGFILLVDGDGQTVIDSIFYSRQKSDVSKGRFPDGGEIFQFMESPSPGTTNQSGFEQQCEQAAFSHVHGFYSESFQLQLSSNQPGTNIFYTLDGTEPTATPGGSVSAYTEPITIDGTSIVRALTVHPELLSKESLTQTYIFLDEVLQQPATPVGFPSNWGHTGEGDYEMDPEIVQAVAYQDQMSKSLLSLPTLSLVMDQDDWFGPEGIYIEGELDKRPTSIEYFSAGDSGHFQINGSVMIVGGSSVNRWKSDKLSMRIGFDAAFGQGKLNFSLFTSDITTYNSLTIDARLNNAWHYGGKVNIKERGDTLSQNDIAQYTRDAFMAEMQNQVGGYAPYGKKVHLYLNGLYWGMHWLHERPDEHFAAAHMGGSADDYSVLKHSFDEVEHGSNDTYLHLLELLDGDMMSPTILDRICENLDIEDLISYLLVNVTLGNSDWDQKNWYATRNEESDMGRWRFHSWDAEHVMEGPKYFRFGKNKFGDPTYLHQKLMGNRDYRRLFMDQVEKLMITEGPLTPGGLQALYAQLGDEVYPALIAESARWGDNRADTPFTRENHWQKEFDWIMNDFFPERPGYVIDRLKRMQFYSDLAAPVFYYQNDTFSTGYINRGDTLDYEKSGLQIYYTDNQTDPIFKDNDSGDWRIHPDALELTSALVLDQSTLIKARATDGVGWSPLEQVAALVKTGVEGLRVTEINFDPIAGDLPGKNYEYLEFKNVGDHTIDLSFAEISGGIEYIFPFGSHIKSGEYWVLASNSEAYELRNKFPPQGDFLKHLSSDGETIILSDFTGDTLFSFRYETVAPWPEVKGRKGYTLVSALTDPTGDPSSAEYYTISCYLFGSPGASEEGCLSGENDLVFNDPSLQAYPNPFNNYLEIEYQLKEEGHVSLCVYDMYGRVIKQLKDKATLPGSHQVRWEPDASTRGILILQLKAGSHRQSIRLVRY